MIHIEHASWSYAHADQPSLTDLDLHIAPGEFIVLCGASGSGKSTALRLMNGLIPHFHEGGTLTGTVTIDGHRTTDHELDVLGRSTGTVLQHPRRQFFADTVPEELAFAMENFGVEPHVIRERVSRITTDLASAVPTGHGLQRLSGGQQQQVAIAAAGAHDPQILLLDEPSSNLSADVVTRLAAALRRIKAAGVTIVLAEHRLRYLDELLDRVVVMRDGRIDRIWTATQFADVSDSTLAAEGLRGDVTPADLPDLPARGASVAPPHTSTVDARGAAAGTNAGFETSGGLELHDIRCVLGGRMILSLDHARFEAGEVVAIRGVNGAGKSTLARVITGLVRARGRITLDGRTLTARARQQCSDIVMQDVQRQLFTDSVSAEIDLAATDTVAATDRADVLASLDLTHLADRHPLSLSGGQQQRLVVAAARVSNRRIVVFDEPSSGVDRRHLASISTQIRQVAADGAIVLLISHDTDLLALAADRQLTLTPVATSGGRGAERPRRHRSALVRERTFDRTTKASTTSKRA